MLNRLQRFLLRNCELLPAADLARYLGIDEVVFRGRLRPPAKDWNAVLTEKGEAALYSYVQEAYQYAS